MSRQIVVDVIGDSKGLNKTLDDATTRTGKFGSVLKGVGMGVGFGLITTGIEAVTSGIGASIEAASNLQQAMGAVDSVFGASAEQIKHFADGAERLGLSQKAVAESAAILGAKLQGMGLSAGESAAATINLQQRAADMAATFGGTTTDALLSISSLLSGERDPIEKYGVSLKEADVQAKILAMGLDTSTLALKKQAVATASMELLMEQTSKTTGQFARESESLAGQQQITTAKMENAAAALGQKFLPVMAAVQNVITTVVIPAMMTLIDIFSEFWDGIQPVIQTLVNELGPVFQEVVGIVQGTVIPVLRTLFTAVLPPLKTWITILATVTRTAFSVIATVIGAAVAVIRPLIAGLVVVFGGISKAITAVATTVGTAVRNVVGFFTGIGTKIGNATRGMFDGIWQAFRSVLNMVIRGWNSIKFTLPKVDLGPLGTFGGFTLGTPDLPYFHQGGIVPGTPGADVPIMAQAGERIIARNERAGAGVTVIVNGSIYGVDGVDQLADVVVRRMRTLGAW